MTETDDRISVLQRRARILWILVIICCVGMIFVSIRRYRPKREVALPQPPASVLIPEPKVEPLPPTEVAAPPARANRHLAAHPPVPPTETVPAVRHFDEHLSSDDALAKDTSDQWISGSPVLPAEVAETDSVDSFVTYWLRDGTAIEYDLRTNRYRVFLSDLPTNRPTSSPPNIPRGTIP